MSNDFYSAPSEPLDFARARSALFRQQWQALETGFDRLQIILAASGTSYVDTATGLAATEIGETFRVFESDEVIVYNHAIGNVAVEIDRFSTSLVLPITAEEVTLEGGGTVQDLANSLANYVLASDLAAPTGAADVGVSGGGSVQTALDARPTSATLALGAAAATIGAEDNSEDTTIQAILDALAPGKDAHDYFFGRAHLSAFLNFLATDGTGATIGLSGDSTTVGAALTVAGFIPDVLLTTIALDRGADYVFVNNRGHSGENTDDWIATRLAADVAATEQLVIFHWGMNDRDDDNPGGQLTLEESLANWDTALTTYRASYSVTQRSIVIMTPNAGEGDGRTPEYFEALSRGLRQLAETHKCAFFDAWNYAREAKANAGQGWDDIGGLGIIAVHPLEAINALLWTKLGHEIFPNLGPYKSNHFWNRRGSSGRILAAATLPAVFEPGITMDRAYSAQGFPADGFVVTFKSNATDTNALQLFWDNSGPQFRIGGAIWLSWVSLGPAIANLTPFGNFSLASTAAERARTLKTGRHIISDGWVEDIVAPAAITASFASPFQIATIGSSGHYPEHRYWDATLMVLQTSDNTAEWIKARIDADGKVYAIENSTKTANKVYIYANYNTA